LKKASRSGEEELREGEDDESQSMIRKVVASLTKGWDERRLNFSHPMVEMATCIYIYIYIFSFCEIKFICIYSLLPKFMQ
jgi:hypothetical protein